jgi:hypothetical protein
MDSSEEDVIIAVGPTFAQKEKRGKNENRFAPEVSLGWGRG